MKIPKTVKVGQWYTVEQIDLIDAGAAAGKVLYNTNTIQLANYVMLDGKKRKVSRTSKEAVLLHEIQHVINWHFNNDKMGEAELDRIANGWHLVVIDNPDMFKPDKKRRGNV